MATTFDGRPLALQGRASLALVTAALASFVGGTVSVILFTLFAPLLATAIKEVFTDGSVTRLFDPTPNGDPAH